MTVVETERNIENEEMSELGPEFAQIHGIELQEDIEDSANLALKAIENQLSIEEK